MKIVDTFEEAKANAVTFWGNGLIDRKTYAWSALSKFQHWYYFEDIDVFAPCKFIGFKNRRNRAFGPDQGWGHEAKAALAEWFRPLSRNSPKHRFLARKLDAFVKANGKKLGKPVLSGHGAIHVLRPEYAQASRGRDKVQKSSMRTEPQTSSRAGEVQQRRGQDLFRERVLKRWDRKCAVSSCKNEALLVAAHIKPWSECNHKERFDGENGLLLMAHLHAAFDAGLISFDSQGRILHSAELTSEDTRLLGVEEAACLRLGKRAKAFMRAHRRRHGFAA